MNYKGITPTDADESGEGTLCDEVEKALNYIFPLQSWHNLTLEYLSSANKKKKVIHNC